MGMQDLDPKWRYAWEMTKSAGRFCLAILVAIFAVLFMHIVEAFGATPEQACFAVAIGFMYAYANLIARVILHVAKTFAEDIDAQRQKAIEDTSPDPQFDPQRDL